MIVTFPGAIGVDLVWRDGGNAVAFVADGGAEAVLRANGTLTLPGGVVVRLTPEQLAMLGGWAISAARGHAAGASGAALDGSRIAEAGRVRAVGSTIAAALDGVTADIDAARRRRSARPEDKP